MLNELIKIKINIINILLTVQFCDLMPNSFGSGQLFETSYTLGYRHL